ncbi:MAG: hypothetical protein A4E73_03904 [Syntrophaceae bacterium PtaU1.Bin231]|nr:MAG: hypothetical protein A4E73_03904 [Syntrophaceae bacterium PtaU1.Bin231]
MTCHEGKRAMLKRRGSIISGLVCLALVSIAVFTVTAGAQSAVPAGPWSYSITPYLWMPNIEGTLNYSVSSGGGRPSVDVGPNDWLENLSGALMISGEVRRDRWLVFTDFIYLDFSREEGAVKSVDFGGSLVNSSANLSTRSSLRGMVWTLGAGYAALSGRPAALEVFGGLRYAGLEASTDWQLALDVAGPGGVQTFPRSGSISERMDLWNGIIGAKGHVRLGGNWSIPYYLDVGTGSGLTWQGVLGIAYSFDSIDVKLVYRHLYFDQGDDKLIQTMRFSGPALGVTFRF